MEHAERRVLEELGHLGDFEIETEVWLIGAVAGHRFVVGDALDRRFNVVADLLPHVHENLLGKRDHVFLISEAHFDVKLRELGLAVGAEVFVAVAASELEVAFHAAHHEQLLEKLRRLRKCVPRSGSEACRDEEVARPLGCRTGKGRCFDLDEVFVEEHLARGLIDFRTQAQRICRFRTAHVQVAVAQASFLADLAVLIELERERSGGVEHLNLGSDDLDVARGKGRVFVTFGAALDLARDLEHELVSQVMRIFFANNDLRHPRSITQIEEGHTAVVTAPSNPAGESDVLADVICPQITGAVGAKHEDSFDFGVVGRVRRMHA